ncbi:hypothetical protein KUTeg_012034 [Tegillarca granosa]|uniref:dolichyl-phosphate-mannose--protein mannosyltransferase n=1 Tax=Tegillarca granosa TaxID=220873 RepID=A0ABQ9EYL2_TEGGR|nr:hypothetical protein KUTeg_012034 [Tegillarca granosa]
MASMRQNGTLSGHVKQNGSTSRSRSSPWKPEWDDCLPVPKLDFLKAGCIVFIAAVLCFINSYNGAFVFDDSEAILSNNDLKPSTPLNDLFIHDFWGKKLDSKTSHKSYRPLTVLTFRWNYALAGGTYPTGFHVVNILLHGVVSVLMLIVFSLLYNGYRIDRDTGSYIFTSTKASLISALLFAVHPIHTESVAGIVGRADLLCALLFILSFVTYVKACSKDLDNSSSSEDCIYRPSSFSVPLIIISMLLCGLSVLCKEQGITVIGICSAFDIIIICRINILELLHLKKSEKHEENGSVVNSDKNNQVVPQSWVKSLVFRHILLVLAGVLILATRLRIMGSTTPTFQIFDNPHSFVNGTIFRVLNYNYLYAINGWLLVNPWWLCFDWSMGCIPVIDTLSDPRILAAGAFWVVLLLLLYVAVKGEITNYHRSLTMGLALLIVPFLPATNVLFRVGFVIAERVLYLSTAGFCIIVVLGCHRLSCNPKYVQGIKYALVALVVLFITRSVQRSAEWTEEMALFKAGAKVCPLNAKVHYNIAKLNGDQGNTDVAIEEYRHAIWLNPEYDQAMNNLANILKDTGDLTEAESLLLKAVSLREEFAAAWMNLGIVQASLKKNQAAEKSYFNALKHRRNYPDCLYNLGNMYLDAGLHEPALKAWKNATIQKPNHLNAWSNIIILLDNLNRHKDAEAAAREALKYLPNQPQIYFNLGNLVGKMDRYQESEQYFLKAVQLNKKDPKIFANLGVLYHRWGKHEAAEKAYKLLYNLIQSHRVQ